MFVCRTFHKSFGTLYIYLLLNVFCVKGNGLWLQLHKRTFFVRVFWLAVVLPALEAA